MNTPARPVTLARGAYTEFLRVRNILRRESVGEMTPRRRHQAIAIAAQDKPSRRMASIRSPSFRSISQGTYFQDILPSSRVPTLVHPHGLVLR